MGTGPFLKLTNMEISTYHSSYLKKSLDVVLSLLLLPCVLLVFLILWGVHFFCDRESVFFIDERVGTFGKKFSIYKFRSIAIDNPGNTNQKIVLTQIYKIMRRCHLDEFPQIINVLKGEMSFIGPRPYILSECEEISESISKFNIRHQIKPGITGLAQMNYQHDNSEEVSLDKFYDDITYMEHADFLLDVRIILNTIGHITRLRGV